MRIFHHLRRAANWLNDSLPGQAIGAVSLFGTFWMIAVGLGVLS